MKNQNACIAIYSNHMAAEEAIHKLQKSKFDMKKLSIVGKDYHTEENVVGYYNTGERMKTWGKFGAFWGGLWGFLVGSAFFVIPGVGPLVIGGPMVSWIVGAMEGALVGGGLSALGAGLFSIGIPKDSVIKYEKAIKADKFLVLVHGTGEEIENARTLLKSANAEIVDAYNNIKMK